MANQLDELLNNNRAGSGEITSEILKLFRQYIQSADPLTGNPEELYKELQQTAKKILKKQPNMALLRRTSNNLLIYCKRLIKSEKTYSEIIENVTKKVDLLEQEIETNISKIVQLSARVIANSNKVMTISNSGLVYQTIINAHKQRRVFEVFALKSHPPDEGIDFAEKLSAKGLNTTVIPDSQAGVFMEDINLVLIGADRVYEDGFINKAGTLPLCLTARHYNVPVYLVAETAKILPVSDRAIKLNPRDGNEVYNGTDSSVSTQNVYFEKVPLDLVHKVACEEGMFDTFEFINWYLKE